LITAVAFEPFEESFVAWPLGFAAGTVLASLANTLMPAFAGAAMWALASSSEDDATDGISTPRCAPWLP
jgi:hypothetical protein